MDISSLFLELIRVAIGTTERLSCTPSLEEWKALDRIADQQSLTGICFRTLQKLKRTCPEQIINIDKVYYTQWLGWAGLVEKRNERLDRQCAFVQKKLGEAGFVSCIFKGRSVAQKYGELCMLRQSGDIDAWVLAEPKALLAWAEKIDEVSYVGYHHLDLEAFSDTSLELHYRPSLSRNLIRNARLQKWFRKEGIKLLKKTENGYAPGEAFDIVLTLNHTFWHLLYEGVGMRHLMDIYYVLKQSDMSPDSQQEIERLIRHFKLQKFCGAAMWMMLEVFGLDEDRLLCKPDERRGRFLLKEIMLAGEFGQFDKRIKRTKDGNRAVLMWYWMKHNWRLIKQYPADVLWTPIGAAYISLWPKIKMHR